ncbi:MAG TPA: hypothetical protein VG755_37380, partial [Nannocystaceae bacterium]|nr:hypothetical protein [Nannocystaceae bacterium]
MQTRARWLGALVLLIAVQVVIVVVVGSSVERAIASGRGGANVWSPLVLGALATVASAAFAIVLAARARSETRRDPAPSITEELDLAMRSLAAERNRFEAVLETM